MYYTEKEVKELLEQAFSEGYDDGIDDTLDYIDENYELDSDDSFDLMQEENKYPLDPIMQKQEETLHKMAKDEKDYNEKRKRNQAIQDKYKSQIKDILSGDYNSNDDTRTTDNKSRFYSPLKEKLKKK